MTSDEAPGRLRELLRDAGIELDRPTSEDVGRAWEVMRQFAEERADDAQVPEDEGDGILAQYGIYAWDGSPHFELGMTRPFSFSDDNGDFSHTTQLHCSFQFAVSDELRALGSDSLWSSDLILDAFFEQALAMPGFRGARDLGVDPLRLIIEYGSV